jgi:hypothetical protein
MSKKIKLDESQFRRIVESMTNAEIDETHVESEPFSDYANGEQKDLAHGEDHKVKNYDNPNLSEQDEDEEEDESNPLSQVGTFPENEFGGIDLEDSDIDELFDYKDGPRRRFTGLIYYDALIPMTDDEEYDKKIALGILENERKKMMNGETYIDNNDSVFFRDKLY